MYSVWTLANLNAKHKAAVFDFDYPERFKTQPGERYFLMCPDGTVIEEPNYQLDGVFGGLDVYELVVDWNRGYIVDALARKGVHGVFREVAEAFDDPLGGDGYAQSVATAAYDMGDADAHFRDNWKHEIGATITFRTNDLLPFPVKISSSGKPRKKYPDMPASYECHQ